MYNIILIFLSCSLFAQSLTLSSNGALTIFPVSPSARGSDIVSLFTTLNSSPFRLSQSQIAIQTTQNGLIPNVQFITPMANFTILVVGYWLPNDQVPPGVIGGRAGTSARFGYIALPVEQVVELIYSPTTIAANSIFTATPLGGTLPVFSVDLAHRSADIIQAVALLSNPPISNTSPSAFSTVSLLTTVNGPFYGATLASNQLITNGVIPRIISVTAVSNSTLLLVQFKPFKTNTLLAPGGIATIVIAPEQVKGIQFTQDN